MLNHDFSLRTRLRPSHVYSTLLLPIIISLLKFMGSMTVCPLHKSPFTFIDLEMFTKSTFKLYKLPVSMKESGQFATFQLIRDFHFGQSATLPWTIRDVPQNIIHKTRAYQF